MESVAFFDLEVNKRNGKIQDIGCIRTDGAILHQSSVRAFEDFVQGSRFLCGHNIVSHDLKFLQQHLGNSSFGLDKAIDTLFWSPLLFPKQRYHALLKDDKLYSYEVNNPLNDAKMARDLFYEEV